MLLVCVNKHGAGCFPKEHRAKNTSDTVYRDSRIVLKKNLTANHRQNKNFIELETNLKLDLLVVR